jgi:hypothetical protein
MTRKFASIRQGLPMVFALALLLLTASFASASNITYNVNRTIGAGSVTGFIQTDGTIGGLTGTNITDWSLTLYTPVQGTFTLYGPNSGNNSVVFTTGSDLSATATQLLFNFSGTDVGVLGFQQGLFSGYHYYCDDTSNDHFYCANNETVTPISVYQSGWIYIPQTGNQVIGTAGNSSTPEPGSLALLGTGIVAATGMLRRKFMV